MQGSLLRFLASQSTKSLLEISYINGVEPFQMPRDSLTKCICIDPSFKFQYTDLFIRMEKMLMVTKTKCMTYM